MTAMAGGLPINVRSWVGHVLVLGGPGSGKTTLALSKAWDRIAQGIKVGESILFLSFSRAAVARLLQEAISTAPREQQGHLHIQTFHSFFWELLQTNAYLLGAPRQLSILLPHEEQALSRGMTPETPGWDTWLARRDDLFLTEGRIAFDLFGEKALALLRGSTRLCELIATRFPLVIVDEAQDTAPDAWHCIVRLAPFTQVVCLADPDQQIFDFIRGVGAHRLADIRNTLQPLEVNLGTANRRSQGTGILALGNDLLNNVPRSPAYLGVVDRRFIGSRPTTQDVRDTVAALHRSLRRATGRRTHSIAILTPFTASAGKLSQALNEGLRPVRHKLLFDETEVLLASRFAAFLLEPADDKTTLADLAEGLDLLAAIDAPSRHGQADNLTRWASKCRNGQMPRAALPVKAGLLIRTMRQTVFTGRPAIDWLTVKKALRASDVTELLRVAGHLDYLIGFRRGQVIEERLSDVWLQHGGYRGARHIIAAALSDDQLSGGDDDQVALQVMTIHKAKGKQFDGVIIVREDHRVGSNEWRSSFVWRDDPHPHPRSRKILRVAITRARHRVAFLQPASSSCPILSPYVP